VRREDDGRRSLLPFVGSGRDGGSIYDYEMFAPAHFVQTLAGLDGYDAGVVSQLPDAMLHSYRQALGTRWARINRDIQQFNRQYGDWDWYYDGDGLGLGWNSRSVWDDGTSVMLGEAKQLNELIPGLSAPGVFSADLDIPMSLVADRLELTAATVEKMYKK